MKFLAILLCLFLSACTTHLPNGCLVDATSYRYKLQAQNKLRGGFARILVVRYSSYNMAHAYLVFSTNGKDRWAYDEANGSFEIDASATDPYVTAYSINLYSDFPMRGELVFADFLP